MAISIRDWPIYIQVLLFLALGVAIVVGVEYLPYFPIQRSRVELNQKTVEANKLRTEVQGLEFYNRKRADLKGEIEALNRELERLKAIVPEEKEVDEFIRVFQGEAYAAGVSVRRLTARPTNVKEYYVEVPFEVEVDGPYYSVLDFFSRLGRVSRVINVGDLTLSGLGQAPGKKYLLRPGTTVTGSFTVTTFYAGAEKAPGKQPGKAPAKG